MCGILALIGSNRPSDKESLEALNIIGYRGPDDSGVWSDDYAWLGTRRLSIIDIGPSGHQPFVDDVSGVVITYNGEIFNYVELRNELSGLGHRFRTLTDTEVVLRAYLEWGNECVEHFNGMWAFVLWNPRRRCAFFSRDRFGIKPLYHAVCEGVLAIASEPKELFQLFPQLRKPDVKSLSRFLGSGKFYDDTRSFYENISVLEEGHNGMFEPGWSDPWVSRYWDFPRSGQNESDLGAAAKSFGTLFDDSVRLRMRSDVPVGVTLSGGLDSTAVLHAAVSNTRNNAAPLLAFTSVYASQSCSKPLDERRWARLAASRYPQVELVEVEARDDEWFSTLQQIVWHMDGPSASPAVFPLWKIMEAARQRGVPVLLEGQGADEYLGGYLHYSSFTFRQHLIDLVRRPSGAQATKALAELKSVVQLTSLPSFSMHLARDMFPNLLNSYRHHVGGFGVLRPEFSAAGSDRGMRERIPQSLNDLLRMDFSRNVLPNLLQYGDTISMANSIENRLPFLDHRLVELVFGMADSMKVGEGETKRVLRQYLRDAGQREIAGRMDKKGYPTPVDRWLSSNNSEVLRGHLLTPDTSIAEYCLPSRIERLIDRHAKGMSGSTTTLHRLLTTEMWLRGLKSGRIHHIA